jgi:nucleotide sugar dehydrogenase
MPLDINAADFRKTFDIRKATVGVVGHGYVGQAVAEFFRRECQVLVYDKAKTGDCERLSGKRLRLCAELREVVAESEVIFLCLPTPMNADGSCHTGVLESVIKEIDDLSQEIKRPRDQFILVIKSTVRPMFTEDMWYRHPALRIVFSPEFLTERDSVRDFLTCNRVVLGGEEDDTLVLFQYFAGCEEERIESGALVVVQSHPTVAEMAKLFTNGFLMTKVLFCNEIHQMCEKLGIPYVDVVTVASLDNRVGKSHLQVPGPDGKLGAGGSCFPKDIHNLQNAARELGVPERLFTSVIERNAEVRPDKDWEQLKGRAVVD